MKFAVNYIDLFLTTTTICTNTHTDLVQYDGRRDTLNVSAIIVH